MALYDQRPLVVFEWMSLDGVFDADNMDQWFNPYHSDARAAAIKESICNSDAFLFGRTTYDMLAPYWSTLRHNEMGVADRLNRAPKHVVTSTPLEKPWSNSTVLEGDIVERVTALKHQFGRGILIQGSGTLVQSLLHTGLVDEYRFLVHPVLMGKGRRLFPEGMGQTKLKLHRVKELSLGVVQLSYVPYPL